MAISRKEIEHIASLARLDSTGGIFDRLADDMQGIVAMVDKLASLISATSPMSSTPSARMRSTRTSHSGIHAGQADRAERTGLPVRRRSSTACCRVRRGQKHGTL